MKSVRIIHAGVGEGVVWGRMAQVVRGTLLPQFMPEAKGVIIIPEYQRMEMTSGDKQADLMAALAPEGIGVPGDLLACMRGESFHRVGQSEVVLETDSLYLLDGHQRIAAARARLKAGQKVQPLGIKILLGTAEEEEVKLFEQHNLYQTNVSSDVHLRNSDTNPTIRDLHKFATTTEGFPKVRWDQQKVPGEQLKARMLFETTIVLHGYSPGKPLDEILVALEEVGKKHGTTLVVQNVKAFFEVVEEIFGVRPDDERDDAVRVSKLMYRLPLLCGLAKLFSKYEQFWDKKSPNKLKVSKVDIKKLRGLKAKDLDRELERAGATKAVHELLLRRLKAAREKPLEERSW